MSSPRAVDSDTAGWKALYPRRLRRGASTPGHAARRPAERHRLRRANLFLHYAFDAWMAREHPGVRGSSVMPMMLPSLIGSGFRRCRASGDHPDTSRVNREVYARLCEGRRMRSPPATQRSSPLRSPEGWRQCRAAYVCASGTAYGIRASGCRLRRSSRSVPPRQRSA